MGVKTATFPTSVQASRSKTGGDVEVNSVFYYERYVTYSGPEKCIPDIMCHT